MIDTTPFPGQVEAETRLFPGLDGMDLAYGDEVGQPTLTYLQESYSVHVVPLSTTNERRP